MMRWSLGIAMLAACAVDAPTTHESTTSDELGASCTVVTPYNAPGWSCYNAGTFTVPDGLDLISTFCDRWDAANSCWRSLAVDCHDGVLSEPYIVGCPGAIEP